MPDFHRSNTPVIETVPIATLRPYPNSARVHSKQSIKKLARLIGEFGQLVPTLVDRSSEIIDGHAVVDALKLLGSQTVHIARVEHLTEVQIKAVRIALNRSAQDAKWDRQRLGVDLKLLTDLGFDIELTAFEVPEVDILISEVNLGSDDAGAEDEVVEVARERPAVTRAGDIWILGRHRLVCGDARDSAAYAALMAEERARFILCDPPYDLSIAKVVGLGRARHPEFAMASGEMGSAKYIMFLNAAFVAMVAFALDGALACIFIDWRHIVQLQEAAEGVFDSQINMAVWAKSNGGMGSLWRSRHELAPIFKVGTASHVNNVRLGEFGRYRTNLWEYAGVNTFRRGRMEELTAAPTPKPVAMLADAILDVTRPNDIVLDPFAGSGSTMIAAEKTGRVARVIEIDPHYCDVVCRRYEAYAGKRVVHAATGLTFEEVTERRANGEAL